MLSVTKNFTGLKGRKPDVAHCGRSAIPCKCRLVRRAGGDGGRCNRPGPCRRRPARADRHAAPLQSVHGRRPTAASIDRRAPLSAAPGRRAVRAADSTDVSASYCSGQRCGLRGKRDGPTTSVACSNAVWSFEVVTNSQTFTRSCQTILVII